MWTGVKKDVQVVKCIIAISTEFLESQYKAYLKILRILNYNLFSRFHSLFNGA